MILWDVVAVISITSGNLEWASITIKNILFWKGLAKSTYMYVLVARAYLAITKGVTVQQLSSLLIGIHVSYRHTILLRNPLVSYLLVVCFTPIGIC